MDGGEEGRKRTRRNGQRRGREEKKRWMAREKGNGRDSDESRIEEGEWREADRRSTCRRWGKRAR